VRWSGPALEHPNSDKRSRPERRSARRACYTADVRLSRPVTAILDKVVARVARIEGVAAIVLGGSQARGTADAKSDIDIGLYYEPDQPFSVDQLAGAAEELDDRHAPGLVTHFGDWGPGVNGGGWLAVDGRHVDFLYRDLGAMRTAVDDCLAGRVKILYQLGHPMGFQNQIYLAELNSCRPLHDPLDAIAALKSRVQKYPEALRTTLIRKHLFDAIFEAELARKPAERGDVLLVAGCLFRAAGFLTLVLYAMNRRYWINDKGAFAESRGFRNRPARFHATAARVLGTPGRRPAELVASVESMLRLARELADKNQISVAIGTSR
jgi:predicted nucleotidyltransferase